MRIAGFVTPNPVAGMPRFAARAARRRRSASRLVGPVGAPAAIRWNRAASGAAADIVLQ
jgi:hypothetical protein